MRGSGVVVVLLIDLVACGSSGPPPKQPVAEAPAAAAPVTAVPAPAVTPPRVAPETTCADVGARVGEQVRARRVRAGLSDSPDLDKLADDWRRVCTESGWTIESRRCFVGAVMSSDIALCFRQLTQAQQDALVAVLPSPPPPPPPPPPAPPQVVPPTLLEGSRIAGDKNIIPDDVTKTEIQHAGKDKIVGSYKLCLSVDGNVSAVNQLKSTGFAAYDAKIQREMRNWRYRAYLVNGKAVPVCTAVTFIYTQFSPPPPPPSPKQPG